jgi:ATP-dependent protease ClpP protease subunit
VGVYSEYLDKNMDFSEIMSERKRQMKRISTIRERDILVYSSDLNKNNAPTEIDYSDLLPFSDQLSNLKGDSIDIILETPGGFAEVVEDLVKLIRSRYEKVGIIVPGYCKSAGTIFAMAGDEILMGPMSALGPIDAQIMFNNKRWSADAFLEGLEKIKKEVVSTGKLNPAYIPILQNISPGEIQHCENAQNLSKKLVYEWLAAYKFKYWDRHSSTNKKVTEKDKLDRAKKIAVALGKQSEWLTHGRSIKITDLESLKLKITDYSQNPELNDAILRYYTLLRMSFENTNIYKIFETLDSQIYRFVSGPNPGDKPIPKNQKSISLDFECPKCKAHSFIQLNLGQSQKTQPGHILFPVDSNIFVCPNCNTPSNLTHLRLQVEAQTRKKVVK